MTPGGGSVAHPGGRPAWVPNSPCTPAACIPEEPLVGMPRRALRCLACAAVLLAGLASLPAVARLRPETRQRLVTAWARTLVRAVGVRVRITPAPVRHDGPRPVGELFVANHVSWLDVAVLAAVRPARMVAKREVGEWPVAGTLVRLGGTLFVARDSPRALPGDVATITAALRSGATVTVFPEGSTWCGARQGAFRRAVFQAALDAGATVRPVALAYRHADGRPSRAVAFIGEDSFAASVWRVAGTRGVVARAEPLAPIPAPAYPNRRALAAAAREAVALGLAGLDRIPVPPRPIPAKLRDPAAAQAA